MSFRSDKITSFSGIKTLKCGNIELSIDKPLVMGILNITPDSFFDGGRYTNKDAWISHTEKMIHDGASIIDIGAVSTRPGAAEVSEKEEIARLLPALELLSSRFSKTVFSIDTYRAKVAELATAAGAGIINDISGGNMDEGMINAVAATGLPYILMHMQGTPGNMQNNPVYHDIINDVNDFFSQKLTILQQAGIKQVILDPGFGFGKTMDHNYIMLNKLNEFKQPGYPVLVGVSRKSMIYKLLKITPEQALPATSAIHMIAVLNGADILRVHDVKEAVEVLKLVEIYTQQT